MRSTSKFPLLLTALLAAVISLAGCSLAAFGLRADAPAPAAAAPDAASPTAQLQATELAVRAAQVAQPSATPLPSATPQPSPTTPACNSQQGRIQRDYLLYEHLPQPLEYLVYTPPCYAEQPDRRYPVLYLIHGQSFTHEQWDRLGADEAASALASAGEAAPFIIVMPRDRVWTPPSDDPFGQALVERLVPEIDQTYRTLPDRAYRAIGGLSRGAGWALHLGLTRWDLFGAIGAHSPVVFWSDSEKLRGWLRDIPPEDLPRLYLDIGEKDRPEIMESATWLENLLTEEGIAHEWHLFQGYHEEDYWQAHVEEYLRWYAAEW